MPAIASFDEVLLQRICDVLADTAKGLTGSEIGRLLASAGIADSAPGVTKRVRLFDALASRQRADQCANNVVRFIQSAMAPVRYTEKPEIFGARRADLNEVLAFGGYRVGLNGQLERADKAETLSHVKPSAVPAAAPVDRTRLKELFDAVRVQNPHSRGFAFERFLVPFFESYGLQPRRSFRIVGEQIDGSFVLDHDVYLVEARWENGLTDQRDLGAFSNLVMGKAEWSRGVFISYSGFSSVGLQAFSRGKSTRIVCMDGLDLQHVVYGNLDLAEVLRRKTRRAAETNDAFVPVRELFPNVI